MKVSKKKKRENESRTSVKTGPKGVIIRQRNTTLKIRQKADKDVTKDTQYEKSTKKVTKNDYKNI